MTWPDLEMQKVAYSPGRRREREGETHKIASRIWEDCVQCEHNRLEKG